MNLKKTLGLYLLTFITCGYAVAQDSLKSDKVKRFEIGLRIGSPDLLTLHGNIILPILNNRIVTGITGGWYSINKNDAYLWGINLDYYFKHAGKGLFVGTEFERNIFKFQNVDQSANYGLTYSIDYKYYYRYYNFYMGYACIWDKLYFVPDIGITYWHMDNYMIETLNSKTNSISLTEPVKNGIKTNVLGLLIRLSFGYRF